MGSQTASRSIVLPIGPTYIASEKLLLQPALPRDDKASLSNTAAAHALAVFHGLSTRYARCRRVTESDALRQTEELVAQLFPEHGPALRSLCRDIEDRAERLHDSRHVLIHGDAHLGNLLPLTGNRVGMIDFDRVSWGYPEQDLASFFGFKLWLRVRDRQSTKEVLDAYPEFVESYNRMAPHPVPLFRAYLCLATTMITERISRGITRCKLTDSDELAQFIRLGTRCLELDEYAHD